MLISQSLMFFLNTSDPIFIYRKACSVAVDINSGAFLDASSRVIGFETIEDAASIPCS